MSFSNENDTLYVKGGFLGNGRSRREKREEEYHFEIISRRGFSAGKNKKEIWDIKIGTDRNVNKKICEGGIWRLLKQKETGSWGNQSQ